MSLKVQVGLPHLQWEAQALPVTTQWEAQALGGGGGRLDNFHDGHTDHHVLTTVMMMFHCLLSHSTKLLIS